MYAVVIERREWAIAGDRRVCVARVRCGVGLLGRFLVVLTVSFLNRVLGCLLPLPIPTDVCNVIVLFVNLLANLVPLGSMEDTNGFVVRVVPIVFVPTKIKLVSS